MAFDLEERSSASLVHSRERNESQTILQNVARRSEAAAVCELRSEFSYSPSRIPIRFEQELLSCHRLPELSNLKQPAESMKFSSNSKRKFEEILKQQTIKFGCQLWQGGYHGAIFSTIFEGKIVQGHLHFDFGACWPRSEK